MRIQKHILFIIVCCCCCPDLRAQVHFNGGLEVIGSDGRAEGWDVCRQTNLDKSLARVSVHKDKIF